MPSVLINGRDVKLLEIRRLILAAHGFQARTVNEQSAAKIALAEQQVKVFVLCHTLPLSDVRECLDWAKMLRQIRPLLLVPSDFENTAGLSVEVFDIWKGPERFVELVDCLLRKN